MLAWIGSALPDDKAEFWIERLFRRHRRVVHRHCENSMCIDDLFIATIGALCHVSNVFIDSCAICFRDYLHRYATFAAPCSNSANHTLAPTNTSYSTIALCLSLKRRLGCRPLRHWDAVTQMFQ